MDARLNMLLQLLDEGFNRKSWHGPNLRGTIRRVTAEQAAWRPAPGRKCIAEIVVHAAYWKYTIVRKLLDEKRGSFPLKGSNWFPLPKPWNGAAWADAIKLLESQHRRLLDAVAAIPPQYLDKKPPGSKNPRGFVVRGIAFHDVYHAGQIQTLKALQKKAVRADVD